MLDAAGSPITNPAVPMTFRLYPAASGGTACWSENRTVDVRNGLFNALLGQTAAINSECLSSDAYLELIVNGETLAPRERLTSVSHAVEASTLPSGAVTRGSIAVNGNIDLLGNEIGNVRSLRGPTGSHVDLMYGQSEDMFIKSNASGNLYVGEDLTEQEYQLLREAAMVVKYDLELLFKNSPEQAEKQGKPKPGKGKPDKGDKPVPGEDPGNMPGKGNRDTI